MSQAPTFSREYLKILQADFLFCIKRCFEGFEEEQQFFRRTVFEKWFNFIEGWIRVHREDVIPHMAELRGKEILGELGVPDQDLPPRKPERKFIDVLKRMVMELLLLSRRHPDDYKLLLTKENWKQFRFARTVRNHLAHPTCDWVPTVERMEMEALIGAYDWFIEMVSLVDYTNCEVPGLEETTGEAAH